MAARGRGRTAAVATIPPRDAHGTPRRDLRRGALRGRRYRDRGDECLTRFEPLAEDVSGPLAFLQGLEACGGGDPPEDVLVGVAAALDGAGWSPEAERVPFLVGDAPSAGENGPLRRYSPTSPSASSTSAGARYAPTFSSLSTTGRAS